MENNNAKIDEIVERLRIYLKKLGWDEMFSQHIKNISKKSSAAVIFSKLADKLCEDKNYGNICQFVEEVDNISNKDVVKLFVAAYDLGGTLYESFESKIKNLSYANVKQIFNDMKSQDVAYGNFSGNELICYIGTNVKKLTHENKVELLNKLGNDGYHICQFAQEVKGLTHDDLVVLIDKLINDNLTYIVEFAAKVKGLTHDDLVKLMGQIVKSENVERIISFAASVDGLTHDDVVIMRDAVIEWGLIENVNDFAQRAKGLTHDDKVILLRAVIKSNTCNVMQDYEDDVLYVVNFAQKVKGLTHDDKVELMNNVIKTCIKTGLKKYIAFFALGVSGLTHDDIIELLKALIKTCNRSDIDIDQIVYVVENLKGLTDDDYDLIVTMAKDAGIDLSQRLKGLYSRAIDDSLTDLINNL